MTEPRMRWCLSLALLSLALVAAGCASSTGSNPESGPDPSAQADGDGAKTDRQLLNGTRNGAWESSYEPLPSGPVLIRGGTVMTAAGEEIAGGDVLLVDGRIEAVGTGLDVPAGADVIDASDRFVTPGIIDTHSHLGVSRRGGSRRRVAAPA